MPEAFSLDRAVALVGYQRTGGESDVALAKRVLEALGPRGLRPETIAGVLKHVIDPDTTYRRQAIMDQRAKKRRRRSF